jgi:hypothetical protein|nr:MAG TPA: replisome organizer [Caudoviricetes sp.]
MTKDETAKILAILNAYYPEVAADPQIMINAWHKIFADYNYAVVEQAAMNFAAADSREYPKFPVPGQIKDQVDLLSKTGDSPEELWNIVYKAIGNSGYRSQEEFEKLPVCCQTWLGGASVLKDLGMTDTEIVNTVTRGQFLKTIGEIKERQEAQEQLPDEVRQALNEALQIGEQTHE